LSVHGLHYDLLVPVTGKEDEDGMATEDNDVGALDFAAVVFEISADAVVGFVPRELLLEQPVNMKNQWQNHKHL